MAVRFAAVASMPENDAPNETPSRGTTLVQALLDLQRERKWGTLAVDGAGTHTCIYLADGKPVSATGGTLSDTLGRLLVREGALTPVQYTATLGKMSDALTRSKPMRFGEAAIVLGLLTPKQVQESLGAQVKQKVSRCIALSHSTFVFNASRDWANRVRRFPSTVEPLILHAAASFDSERTDSILRPEAGTRARLLRQRDETAAAFALGPAEQRFLSMIDGGQTVHQLLVEDDVDAAAILVALALAGHLVITDASKPVMEPLEPPPSVPGPRVSYAEIARELRRHLISFTAAKTPAATTEAARAPETSAAEPKSPEHARLIAEAAFQLGAGYLRSNSLARAVQELRRAADLSPDAAEYTLYAKWAEFANDQAKLEAAEKGSLLASLEVSAEAALEQVTDMGFAHYVLGQVYLHEGDDDRALRSFRRAVRLEPELIDADRHVRLLELRKRRSSNEMPVAMEVPAAAEEKPTLRVPPPDEAPPRVVAVAPPVPTAARPAPEQAAPRAPSEKLFEPKVVIAPATTPPDGTAPSAPVTARAETTAEPPVQPENPPPPAPPPTNDVPTLDVKSVLVEELVAPMAPAPPAHPWYTNEPIETGAVVARLYSPKRARRRLALAIAGVALTVAAAIGVAAIGLHRSGARGATSASPLRPAVPTPVVDRSATAPSLAATDTPTAPDSAQSAEAATIASAAPADSTTAASPSDGYGTVQATLSSSNGHRITFDGHSLGDAPGPYRVPCGWHKVQLGSHGKVRRIAIACSGTTDIDR